MSFFFLILQTLIGTWKLNYKPVDKFNQSIETRTKKILSTVNSGVFIRLFDSVDCNSIRLTNNNNNNNNNAVIHEIDEFLFSSQKSLKKRANQENNNKNTRTSSLIINLNEREQFQFLATTMINERKHDQLFKPSIYSLIMNRTRITILIINRPWETSRLFIYFTSKWPFNSTQKKKHFLIMKKTNKYTTNRAFSS